MTELNQKFDEFAKTVHDFQEGYKANNEIMTEGLSKLADDSAAQLEAINNVKVAQEADTKKLEELEKVAYRSENGEKAEKEELISKYNEQLALYLRKGNAIDEDVKNSICNEIAQKSFKGLKADEFEKELKTLQVQVNPDGGYWVLPEQSSKTVDRVFETSPMRSVASVITTTAESVEMIIDDNEAASGGWVSETGTRGETDTPQIGKLAIHAHEQFAQPYATQKMLDDAGFDIEGWLNTKIRDKMLRTENTAFMAGDGVAKPKGILSYASWASAGVYERDALERVNSGAAADFTYNGLVELQNSLKDEYQANAVFMLKRSSWTNLLQLVDGNDRPLLNMDLLKDNTDKVLLGKRVIFADDVPAVSGGNEALVYGDFARGYTIVDRIGFRVIRDNVTTKPYIKFYTTKRVGGAVTNYESLKIQTISA